MKLTPASDARRTEARVAGYGRFVSYFVVAGVLAAGLVAVIAVRSLQETSEQRLAQRTDLIVYDITTSAKGLASALGGTAGFFAGSEEVRRDEFYEYIVASDIRSAYPVFSTFAYVERVMADEKAAYVERIRGDRSVEPDGYPQFSIVPEGERDEYWPITYIDPERSASGLLGIDQAAEPVRRENIAFARDTGEPSLSSAITLAPRGSTGFIFAVPIYAGGTTPTTLDGRRGRFAGAGTIAIYVEDFLAATLRGEATSLRDVHMDFFDLGRNDDGTDPPFYVVGAQLQPSSLADLLYQPVSKDRYFEFGGRTWKLSVTSEPGYGLSPFERAWPIGIFGLGLLVALIGFMVSGLIKWQGIINLRSNQSELLRQRQEIIRTLSHQLRTPLTGTRWGLETLLEDCRKSEQSIVRDVIDKTDQLSKIVDRILFYLETVDGYRPKMAEHTSIDGLCRGIVDALREKANQRDIEVEVVAEGPVAAMADVKHLRLAISYLVDNALDYSRGGSRIVLSIRDDADGAEIRVEDQGLGIPEKERGRIFEAFFRATNASETKNVGSGVSLSIAKIIIEGHGGTLTFDSEEGKGSDFVIRLPTS